MAWFSSCEARTNAPGWSRIALATPSIAPPVSGTRNTSACCAPWGTRMSIAASFGFHVRTSASQSLGGGLVAPRKKASTMR